MNYLRRRPCITAAIFAVGLGVTALINRDSTPYDKERFIRDGFMGADYLEVNRIFPKKYLGLMSDVETRYAINQMSPERISIHGTDIEAGKSRLEENCGPSREVTRSVNGNDVRVRLELLVPESSMGCLERGR